MYLSVLAMELRKEGECAQDVIHYYFAVHEPMDMAGLTVVLCKVNAGISKG